MGHDDTALAGLPEAGEPVFYPKVGHCIFRGVTEDRVAPGTQLLELEDLEEGSRILIPLARVPELNLRPAGIALDEIKEVLGADFEEPMEDEDERHALIEQLITEGSPKALALSLKRLHLLRQSEGLSREEEQTRKKIRSWLAAEVSISRECTRAEAQAFMTRVLQESMAEHQRKEKEEAKERRRAARAQKKAEEAAADRDAAMPIAVDASMATPDPPSGDEPAGGANEPAAPETLDSVEPVEPQPLEDEPIPARSGVGEPASPTAETEASAGEPNPTSVEDESPGG